MHALVGLGAVGTQRLNASLREIGGDLLPKLQQISDSSTGVARIAIAMRDAALNTDCAALRAEVEKGGPIARTVVRPLEEAAQAAGRMAGGDVATPVPAAPGRDEASAVLQALAQTQRGQHRRRCAGGGEWPRPPRGPRGRAARPGPT